MPEWPENTTNAVGQKDVLHRISAPSGLRLSGLEIVLPKTPADAYSSEGLRVIAAGELVIESCLIRRHPEDVVDEVPDYKQCGTVYCAVRVSTSSLQSPPSRCVIRDNAIFGGVGFHDWRHPVLVARNVIENWRYDCLDLPRAPDVAIVRHNVLRGGSAVLVPYREPINATHLAKARYEVSNNVIVTYDPVQVRSSRGEKGQVVPLPEHATLRNNLFVSKLPSGGIDFLDREDLELAKTKWTITHNAYVAPPLSPTGTSHVVVP